MCSNDKNDGRCGGGPNSCSTTGQFDKQYLSCSNSRFEIDEISGQKRRLKNKDQHSRLVDNLPLCENTSQCETIKKAGSRYNLVRNIKSGEKTWSFVIHPYSNLRFLLDMVTVFVIYANLIFVPAELAYSIDKPILGNVGYKLITDSWLIVDMLTYMRTGYVKRNYREEIEFDPAKIFQWYFRKHFIFDFISSVPFDIFILWLVAVAIDDAPPREINFLRLLKLLAFFRLFRGTRSIQLSQRLEYIFKVPSDTIWSTMRIVHPIFVLFLFAHYGACMIVVVPKYMDFPDDSWVRRENLDEHDWWTLWTVALFKSQSMMITSGYGKEFPSNLPEMWAFIASKMASVMAYAFFTGNIIAILQYKTTVENAYQARESELSEFFSYKRLPRNMQARVKRYYTERFRGRVCDEKEILSELSEPLRNSIIWYNTSFYVKLLPYFSNCSDNFICAVGGQMEYQVYLDGDMIARRKKKMFHLYVICYGDVAKVDNDLYNQEDSDEKDQKFAMITSRSHFGKFAIFSDQLTYEFGYKAVGPVTVYCLTKRNYESILEKFPDDANQAKIAADKLMMVSGS